MVPAILGKKVGMTRVYDADGRATAVTAIEAGPCVVMQVKTEEKDGYNAVQLGFDDKRRKTATKAEQGTARKASTEPKRFVREIEWDGEAEMEVGATIDVASFEGIGSVDIVGTTKGRGFAGTIKRHNFGGGPKTHGQSDRHRAPGSIGQSASPARVLKGTRMSGHMGNVRRTARNLRLVEIDAERNLLLIGGSVPGANGGYLIIRKSIKDCSEGTSN